MTCQHNSGMSSLLMLTKFIALCPSWETDRNYPFTLPRVSLSYSQAPAIGPYLEAEEAILHKSSKCLFHTPLELFVNLPMNLSFFTLMLLMPSTCVHSLKSTRGRSRVSYCHRWVQTDSVASSDPRPMVTEGKVARVWS